MLIAYIDESYDVLTRVGYFVSVGVVHERHLAGLWRGLLNAASSVVPALPANTERHGAHLFGGDRTFVGLPPNTRVGVYRRGLEAVAEHAEAVMVASDIPVAGPRTQSTVAAWRMDVLNALVPLLESFARAHNEYIVLVCDEEHATTTQVVAMLHRGRQAAREVLGTPIIETAMFAHSADSPGAWGADLVAFAERRLALEYDDPTRVVRTLRRFRNLYQGRRAASVHLK